MGTKGIILMGGQSSRFGSPKANFQWQGQSLAEHAIDLLIPFVDEVVLIARPNQTIGNWHHHQVLRDNEKITSGPLRGIHQAFHHFPNDNLIVIPCDAPWINPQLIHLLAEFHNDYGAVFEDQGLLLPFPSLWTPKCISAVQSCIEEGIRSPRQCLKLIPSKILDSEIWNKYDSYGRSFQSANTPEELL